MKYCISVSGWLLLAAGGALMVERVPVWMGYGLFSDSQPHRLLAGRMGSRLMNNGIG